MLLGEFKHPDNFDIDFALISHKLSNIERTEDGIVGDVEFLNTTKGTLILSLVEAGFPIEFGCRAIGRTNDDGSIEVDKVLTWDVSSSLQNEKAQSPIGKDFTLLQNNDVKLSI